MVYRVYVEKKNGLEHEATSLTREIIYFLGIKSLTKLRIINRYDVESIDEELFKQAKQFVFSEPQVDVVSDSIDLDTDIVFAVEYLPGQFDQRADSAAQCIQLISQKERPLIRTAKVYVLEGNLNSQEIDDIKKYVINPVEAREAGFELPDTLNMQCNIPTEVETIAGFIDKNKNELIQFLQDKGLAMDIDDLLFCQEYFCTQKRNPTITEIKMIDTYWSDHCRHTTFMTNIDSISFEDKLIQDSYNEYIKTREILNRTKPVSLMDIATIAVKYLKKEGKLDKLDESDEINACTVKVDIEVDGVKEPWLLLFKNETHNHPTEIEPFGGAATCIGGAIRDPLSGRSYVYGAMRVTGAADPCKPISETIKGKLPQRKIVTTAAAGYSSYGNQIGLATGLVDEIYHDGYAAKRMEIGAVIAATPRENVRREKPLPGDIIILLGGNTGRDGCGGATGSSKSHTTESLETCGAEVQKGNAPEERKLQRLFRNKEACLMIKKCNDFGAGGVSVAVGELADGLIIDLNAVPKKYEGLDGTELAISESQERMAVVVEEKDVKEFIKIALSENIQATIVAKVTDDNRLTMIWNNKKIVDIDRTFLDSNGAEKHIDITVKKSEPDKKTITGSFSDNIRKLASELNICSKRGLSERFDSTIGAGTVLMPFGGKNQLTPIQAMVQKISVEKKHTDDCSLMSYGYNPIISSKSPYHGAYLAVIESVSKLIASGADFKDVYLTFQEYFEHPGQDSTRWGKPVAALLGAFKAQMNLQIAAIGGKDSMSGSFEDMDVPPTLVSFAVTTAKTSDIISPELKAKGHKLIYLKPDMDENGLPVTESLLNVYTGINKLIKEKKIYSCYTPCYGGIAEALMKMSFGNMLGIELTNELSISELFDYAYGSFIIETDEECGRVIGTVTDNTAIKYNGDTVNLNDLLDIYESKLEKVYPCNIVNNNKQVKNFCYEAKSIYSPSLKVNKPKVLIPVFPGTNCEYDSAKIINDSGADAKIVLINNLSSDGILKSIDEFSKKLKEAQMIFIPGGFSAGDEPDGSGKFITAFFRNEAVKEGVDILLNKKDGLICGICNGFQALIKLGLVPYGKIIDTDEKCPTITYNTIGRHQSRIVRTRICSNKSPWLSMTNIGDIYNVPISHGEGKFVASEELISELSKNGQIATQYVDLNGNASDDIHFNPNDSMYAIEGITSPDGRVFGKMGHSERIGHDLYKNVYGNYDIHLFEAAVKYFK